MRQHGISKRFDSISRGRQQSTCTDLYKNDSVRDLVLVVRRPQYDPEKRTSSLLHVVLKFSTKERKESLAFIVVAPGNLLGKTTIKIPSETSNAFLSVYEHDTAKCLLPSSFLFLFFNSSTRLHPFKLTAKERDGGNSHQKEEEEEGEKRKECDDKI
jgi:hypothetical protein